jgi:hypothetical protein
MPQQATFRPLTRTAGPATRPLPLALHRGSCEVRSRAGTVLGHLPANRIARLSADGKKAYIYIHADGGLGKIQVIDLTASIAPSGTFPVLNEVAVPYDMGDSPAEVTIPSTQPNFAMTLSSDERSARRLR